MLGGSHCDAAQEHGGASQGVGLDFFPRTVRQVERCWKHGVMGSKEILLLAVLSFQAWVFSVWCLEVHAQMTQNILILDRFPWHFHSDCLHENLK